VCACGDDEGVGEDAPIVGSYLAGVSYALGVFVSLSLSLRRHMCNPRRPAKGKGKTYSEVHWLRTSRNVMELFPVAAHVSASSRPWGIGLVSSHTAAAVAAHGDCHAVLLVHGGPVCRWLVGRPGGRCVALPLEGEGGLRRRELACGAERIVSGGLVSSRLEGVANRIESNRAGSYRVKS
jgi:hypothetical protein